MRPLISCVALFASLLLAASAPAQAPTITLPEVVKGDVGAFIRLSVQTNGKEVRWVAVTPGLAVFPAELLKDSRTTVVSSAVAGEYLVIAYTAVGDVPSDPATARVVIGRPAPPPAPPAPEPPTPPPAPPVDVPSAELQQLVAPLRALTQLDRVKAAVWASAWSDFHLTLKTTQPPAKTSEFKSAITAFMNAAALKGGLQGAFPGYSAALERAFVGQFGDADASLDPSKATAFVAALAWAAGS